MSDCRSLAKKLIAEKKLSIEGLAFKSDRSYSTTANWLSGKSVSFDTEKAFARVLNEVFSENKKAAG